MFVCGFSAAAAIPLFCFKRRTNQNRFCPKKNQETKITTSKIPPLSPTPTVLRLIRPRNGVPPFKKFPACKATPKRCLCKWKDVVVGGVGGGWMGWRTSPGGRKMISILLRFISKKNVLQKWFDLKFCVS